MYMKKRSVSELMGKVNGAPPGEPGDLKKRLIISYFTCRISKVSAGILPSHGQRA
jgi:hypothetical protein